jgi:hypothetical protein
MDGIHGLMPFLGQEYEPGAAEAGAGLLMGCICPLVLVLALPALMFWKVFEKAGVPGWMSVVPILNVCKLCEIAGRPAWWGILFLIPIVSLVISILVCIDLAKKFGKDTGYAIGLALLGIVFFPMLGFGDATYDKSRT